PRSTTPASSTTRSPRPSRPTARRWSTCTSTRWPRSSRWSPRARAPTRSSSGTRPSGGLVELGDPDAGADGLGVEVHLLLQRRRHLGRQRDLELAVLGLVGLV